MIRSELLAPMKALTHWRKGPLPYYLNLRLSEDPVLAIGAWCALFDGKHLKDLSFVWPDALPLCRYRAVRQRAFAFFENEMFEHDLAARAARTDAEPLSAALTELMRSELAFDPGPGADAAGRAYLATGDASWLTEAIDRAEAAGGWRLSQPWMVRTILIDPGNMEHHRRFLEMLDSAGQGEIMGDYAQLLASLGLFPQASQVFVAGAELYAGRAEEAIKQLESLSSRPADPGFAAFKSAMLQIKAKAEEKTRQFAPAYRDYIAMNASESPSDVNPEDYFKRAPAKKMLNIPELPPDPRTDVIQMVGFARSGTTLLENALGQHPSIETFEEIQAMKASIDMIEFVLSGRLPMPPTPAGIYLKARDKYYEELDIRRKKRSAHVVVDKMPMRTSEADYLKKVFPDWRYIFSIRHPYDVVLSCFKQRFVANPAMENFRTIEGTIHAYDHNMSEWFALHALDDPQVHYVRYDDLVTDFEPVTRGVLDFLGLDWADAINDFATAAEQRAGKTPSYQKVRQGLKIGVQTYWRDYRFVFDTEVARPLRKWVELFGYEA
jgi:sulfotransferase family protein